MSALAILALTAQQKKTIEKSVNNMGSFSHPNTSKMERKIISTGMVMSRSVIMESSGLGSGCLEDEEKEGRARSSANFAA